MTPSEGRRGRETRRRGSVLQCNTYDTASYRMDDDVSMHVPSHMSSLQSKALSGVTVHYVTSSPQLREHGPRSHQ